MIALLLWSGSLVLIGATLGYAAGERAGLRRAYRAARAQAVRPPASEHREGGGTPGEVRL